MDNGSEIPLILDWPVFAMTQANINIANKTMILIIEGKENKKYSMTCMGLRKRQPQSRTIPIFG